MKICSKCKNNKDESMFSKDNSRSDGFRYWCNDCYKEYQKEYQKEYRKKYRKTEVCKKIIRKYLKKKRIIDPIFKLDSNMASAIRNALKGKKAGRRWEKLVGYTINDLIKHLETKFNNKMNWENQGIYWHIDHIKPKSLFHYTCPEDKEFKECWALDNLQPLEAMENIKKSNKY